MANKYRDAQGYIRLYSPDNPCSDTRGYVYEHRQTIAEKLKTEEPDHPALTNLGCLRPTYYVHHEDENKSNNHKDNLSLQPDKSHKSYHFTVNNPHPKTRDEKGRYI